MRRLYRVILVFVIAIVSFNCQKEANPGGPDLPGNHQITPDPITSNVQGNIWDENGKAAMGVSVKVGTKTAITNAHGYFRINNASLDKQASLVTAEKTGYFKGLRVFGATSGTNHVEIQLIKKTLAGTIDAAGGGNVSLANGSKIALPANSVVKAGGGAYSGTVNIYAAYIDPTSDAIHQTIPGYFLALDKSGKKVVLTSYGMLAVELESSSGEKLQVAPGKTATLTTAIPLSLQPSAPSSISLSFLDEQTGIWKEEGSATRSGNAYVGEVKHFSFWICDMSAPTVNLKAKFVTTEGVPITNAYVYVKPASGVGGFAQGRTDSLGQVNGPIPANVNLVLQIMSPCVTALYVQNIAATSSDVDLGTVTINNPQFVVTIEGKLLDCNGAPVTNGYAAISYNNGRQYASADANGDFRVALTTCGGLPVTCAVVGIDASVQQQGAAVHVPVVSPLTNTGNITACGTSSLEYINYTIDGVNYSISNLVSTHVLGSSSKDTNSVFRGGFMGMSSASFPVDAIGFEFFSATRAAGTYPIYYVYLSSTQAPGGASLVRPFYITITNYPQVVGEFFEGSFSGQYLSNGLTVTHNISCSFRVRRSI